jgi:hypothetical protein
MSPLSVVKLVDEHSMHCKLDYLNNNDSTVEIHNAE